MDQELLLRNEYLTAENRILRAQIKGRLLLSDPEKARLAEIAHRLGRKALKEVAAAATPDTLLAWYRKLTAKKFDESKFRKSVGRPPVDEEIERLVVRMSRENPSWGYDRIVGAMANLRHKVSDQTIGNILRRHDIPPAPKRKTNDKLERIHPRSPGSNDGNRLLHGGSAYAQKLKDILRVVFHSLGELANLLGWCHRSSGSRVDGANGPQYHDGGSPNLNAYAERWVRSVKGECVAKLILFGERSLKRALHHYELHYHGERNHQHEGADQSQHRLRSVRVQQR